MLSIIIPIINTLLGGVIKPFITAWITYEKAKLTSGVAGFEAATNADAKIMQAAIISDAQLAALKVQVYGSFTYRIISLMVGGICAIHFSMVIFDTILASKFLYGAPILGVPSPPGNYATWEWAIISSFFLVQAINLGKSNVSAWLSKSK